MKLLTIIRIILVVGLWCTIVQAYGKPDSEIEMLRTRYPHLERMLYAAIRNQIRLGRILPNDVPSYLIQSRKEIREQIRSFIGEQTSPDETWSEMKVLNDHVARAIKDRSAEKLDEAFQIHAGLISGFIDHSKRPTSSPILRQMVAIYGLSEVPSDRIKEAIQNQALRLSVEFQVLKVKKPTPTKSITTSELIEKVKSVMGIEAVNAKSLDSKLTLFEIVSRQYAARKLEFEEPLEESL